MAAFFPFKATFFEILDGKPDLYGPFWIYATLVFSLAASGNISGYLSTPAGFKFTYNFDFIPSASSLLFGVALIVPITIYVVMKMLCAQSLSLASVYYIINNIGNMHLRLRLDLYHTSMCNLRNPKSSIVMGCSNICHDKLIVIFDSELLEVKYD